MLSEEQYLLAMRQRVDQLKARADLPHYKYATEDQPRLIAYFIKRAVQFGEAAYRIEVAALAVPEALSWLGVQDRYIRQIQATGSGRMVSRENHDNCYAGMVDSLG